MGAPAVSPRARPGSRPKPKARPRPATRSRVAAPAGKPRPAAPRTNHRSRSRIAAGGSVAMLPVNAVGGIADSGFVVGLTRGRAWIVALGLLLGGIVALNVLGLSLSSSGSDAATKVDDLQQANSVLQARIANRLSNERIAKAAGDLGLAVPAPDAVHYLGAKRSDAEAAADRLARGLIANAPPAAEAGDATTATETTAVAPVDPAAAVDPTTGMPVDATATTATTTTIDPALATPATTTP
jgi:hypothetical protein